MQQDKLIALFQEQFKRCKLKAEESVIVLSGDNSPPEYVKASLQAARNLGTKPFQLHLPPVAKKDNATTLDTVGTTPVTGIPIAIEALKKADFIVDLLMLLHSPEQVEILNSGARMLLILEPPEVFEARPSTDQLRHVIESSAERLKKATKLRVTSGAGTDLEMDIGDYPVITQYGFTDTPGRWDHWPSAFLYTWPNEQSTNGSVVLDVDDFVWPLNRYLESKILLTVQHGYITAIEGGADAQILREQMAGFNDPEAYAVSHMGWGVDPRADWFAIRKTPFRVGGSDPRSFAGNVQFSTGPNTEAGGTRNTIAHFDMPMRGCTLTLDDNPVVQNGELVKL